MADILNLNDLASEVTRFTIDVDREAGFDNTVDFYEVDANGNVIDADGNEIAPGEDGYADAAIASRLGLDLATENRKTSEFNAEFTGGAFYAPVIAVDDDFDLFLDSNPNNDPTVYFTYEAANVDGFDHVDSLKEGQFSFEDLPNGGDEDFNDIVLNFEAIEEPIDEKPIGDPDLIQGVDLDIVLVIDVSLSTIESKFVKTINTEDFNKEGKADRILDLETAGFTALNRQLIDRGLSEVDLEIVTSVDSTQTPITTTPSANEDDNGEYVFEGLAADTYTVREIAVDNSVETTAEELTISLGDAKAIENVDLGEIADEVLAVLNVESEM